MPWLLLIVSALAAEVTFPDAVREAMAHAPAVRVAEGEYRADLGAALASRVVVGDPTVQAQTTPDEESVVLSVQVPLAGQPIAAAAAASRARDAASVRYDAEAARAALAAGEAYLELERAERLASLADESLALALRSREASARLLATGEIAAVDAAVAASVTAEAANRASRARQDALRSRRQLEIAMGREPVAEALPAGWPGLRAPEVPEPLLPEVRAAELDARRARSASTLARLQTVPSPQLSAGWVRVPEGDGLSLGASVRLPLVAPGIGPARMAAGQADVALATAEAARLRGLEAWRSAGTDLETALTAAELARVDGLEAALASVNAGFEAGEYSLGEYVARRDAVLEGLVAQVEARFRVEQATLRLWQLLGELPPEVSP